MHDACAAPPTVPTPSRGPPDTPVPSLIRPSFVVIVRNGPTHDLSDQLEYHAELLGRIAPGLLLTNGPRAAGRDVGRVRIECLATRDRRSVLAKAHHAARAVHVAVRALRASGLPGLVVSYDPFSSGAIARAIKACTGASFVCELNGAYGNRDNFADLVRPADRERLRARMLRFGSWTLRGADGIRLLFDGQLAGFTVDPRIPVRRYFDPVPLDRFADLGAERYVLFVGHPFRRKGVDVLLRAFARVRPMHPQWRLLLVGHELQAHCAASGLPLDGVEVLPPTNNSRLAPLLGRCGIFVLPSRSEAMGRVLVEAAAAGKPRIGADVDGIPTVIAHGNDGLLFPKEDDAALAAALARLMRSPELRDSLAAAARARVAREFSAEAYLRAFAGLANAVLANSDGAAERPPLR